MDNLNKKAINKMFSVRAIKSKAKTKYLKRTKDRGPSEATRKKQNQLTKKVQYEKWREIFFKKTDENAEPNP